MNEQTKEQTTWEPERELEKLIKLTTEAKGLTCEY